MPFSVEISDHTRFMSLDVWLEKEIKHRDKRLAQHKNWSKEKLEGYEAGLVDMALDVKNKVKRLDTNDES